jgi:hypothetical protein
LPAIDEGKVLRLALDINVLVSDLLAARMGRRATASTMLVNAVRDGTCPAGPVQLVTSLPVIENFANVLQRRLGYSAFEAAEKAWLLEQYTMEGPVPDHPYVTVGTGYIPFEIEVELRQAVETFAGGADAGRLFNEVRDDRYVLETALAGRADILVTANIDDFIRGPAIRLERDDVVLFPFGGRTLVIATPGFAAYWRPQGIVPDAAFIAARPDEFMVKPVGRKPG